MLKLIDMDRDHVQGKWLRDRESMPALGGSKVAFTGKQTKQKQTTDKIFLIGTTEQKQTTETDKQTRFFSLVQQTDNRQTETDKIFLIGTPDEKSR